MNDDIANQSVAEPAEQLERESLRDFFKINEENSHFQKTTFSQIQINFDNQPHRFKTSFPIPAQPQ
jgi:hypothetical protein